MTASPPDLVLVDGSSYLYRAFHALPPLTSSRGEPTGALLGVLNMMVKFFRDYPPRRIAMVFDASGKTFRDDLFARYKAHRPRMPDDLRSQVEPLFSILRAQGLPLLRVEGVEADDVIGTLATQAAARGESVLISTGDKDMAQLVNGSITLINTMSDTVLDTAGVKAKFDVEPGQIIDYLALVGDTSDNIPGIDKIGPKTAAKLLEKYGTLDNLIAHVAEVPGKVGENLRAGLETLELSRKLATIRTDVPLPVSLEALTPTAPDVEALRQLYTRFELRRLLEQLQGGAGEGAAADSSDKGAGYKGSVPPPPAVRAVSPFASIERHYETVTRWADLERWLAVLQSAPLAALAIQTTRGDYMHAQIVGLSLCVEPGTAAYVPLGHDYPGAPEQLERARVLEALKPWLTDPKHGKLGSHLKAGAHALLASGIEPAGLAFDTMLESYVWNSVATAHDLASNAQHYLGISATSYDSIAGKGARQLPVNQVPVEQTAAWAAQQADLTLCVHRTLWPQLESLPALARLYQEVEEPLVPVLLRMERHGVGVDRERLRTQSHEISRQLEDLKVQAQREAGTPFNIDSPRQLQQILFEKLHLPVNRKTPTGQPSTAEDVLEELAASYALPRLVLDYRALAKLKST